MVLKYIKSIWQSNFILQVRTSLTTFISTTAEQLHIWVGDIIGQTGDDTYKVWSKRIESLHYYYEQDIDYIIDRMTTKDIKFNDLFLSVGGQHPPIVKMFLSKKINFETLVILDDILKFTKKLNKDITEKVLWPKLCDRMIRYRPFLSYNITKYKISLRDKMKDI